MPKNVNSPIVVNGGLSSPDPWEYGNLVSQVAAQGSITFTGSVAPNTDVITVTLLSQQLPTGSWVWNLTAASQTLAQLATALKNAINADLLLASLGITATSSGAVVTITWGAGPLGNFATITFGATGSASETATIVQFKGGDGYVIPQQDGSFVNNRCPIQVTAGQPIQVDYAMLKNMIDSGISVK